MKIPLIRPAPPRLSVAARELHSLEQSGIFSNFGPVNTRFEQELLTRFFGGKGACTTVCNATPGQFALMPSFTFAAAAHAALWCGLTPLLCDIDPTDWAADSAAEYLLLTRYLGRIAVVVPYATFGYPIDLERYKKVAGKFGIPVVVDAAASLGTFDAQGIGFGSGFAGSVVFSMHATKPFAVGEGGLIYSSDPDRIARLRVMSNFGFGETRTATMAGLNAKLSEVGALLGRLRLADYDRILAHRTALLNHYRDSLPDLDFQSRAPGVQAHQFVPALLPSEVSARRTFIRTELAEKGVVTGTYFSPHLFEQPYFQKTCAAGPTPVCNDVSARVITLPLFDAMTHREVDQVAHCLRNAIRDSEHERSRHKMLTGRNAQAVRRASEETTLV
jgi:dTDP-4-amino-4,6-dideoxygalactose transaminase